MINRKTGPKSKEIRSIEVPDYYIEVLANGTKLISIPLGTSQLTGIEILNKGGRFLEEKKGVARATARLLRDGTQSMSSSEIAENIDFYGATLSTGAQLDYSYIKLLTLSKYIDDLLPILYDIRYNPIFPEAELERYKETSIENLKIQMDKNDVLSYRILTEELYGSDHPYGYNSTKGLFENLSRADIQRYFETAYGSTNSVIIISGQVDDEVLNKIRHSFGENRIVAGRRLNYMSKKSESKSIYIPTLGKTQASIRIGMPLFKRDHPDYTVFYVLNTILGGYFGSRLMKRIREEKAYTYGIYSSLDTMLYDGYFSISTDVNVEYVEDTIKCIHEEILNLINNPITPQELLMVKNYINGTILNLIDGPFKVAGIAKAIELNNLPIDYFERFTAEIAQVTPRDIQACADKYFSQDNMIQVIVGKSKN